MTQPQDPNKGQPITTPPGGPAPTPGDEARTFRRHFTRAEVDASPVLAAIVRQRGQLLNLVNEREWAGFPPGTLAIRSEAVEEGSSIDGYRLTVVVDIDVTGTGHGFPGGIDRPRRRADFAAFLTP